MIDDLGPQHVELLVNGARRDVLRFARAPRDITAVLLVDISGSMRFERREYDRVVRSFADIFEPGDRVRLGTVGRRILFAPGFATSRDELLSARSQLFQSGGPSPIWDAIDQAVTELRTEHGRRVIIMVTDGRANGNTHNTNSVLHHALAEGCLVYFASPRDEDSTAYAAASPFPGALLQEFAAATGARRVPFSLGGRGPAPALRRIVAELRRQYVLEFTSTAVPGDVEPIEIRVNRPGITVRTRARHIIAGGR